MSEVERERRQAEASRRAHHGIGFHLAALRALEGRAEKGGTVEWLAVPAVVNLAFACELYLKSLLMLETGTSHREHRLSVLFAKLSSEAQRDATVEFGPRSLKERLDECSDAFREWRYVFELNSASINHSELLDIADTLLAVVGRRVGVGVEFASKITAQRGWSRV